MGSRRLKREVGRVVRGRPVVVWTSPTVRRTRYASVLWERIKESYDEKEKLVGRDVLQRVERDIMLQIVDTQWKDHLYSLDHLKEGIGLARLRPARPAHRIQEGELRAVPGDEGSRGRGDRSLPVVAAPGSERRGSGRCRPVTRPRSPLILSGGSDAAPPSPFGPSRRAAPAQASARPGARPSGARRWRRRRREDHSARRAEGWRNDPCPCGSGKKYKKCHGRNLDRTRGRVAWNWKPKLQRCSRSKTGLATALTFDDVLLVPQAFRDRSHPGGRHARWLTRNIRLNVPLVERRHGHRHRVPPGDCDGAARRPRRDSQELVDRRAGARRSIV